MQQEAALRSHVVAVLSTILNGGSYNSFGKPWSQYVWESIAKSTVPSRTTAAKVMHEVSNEIAALNFNRLQVANFVYLFMFLTRNPIF